MKRRGRRKIHYRSGNLSPLGDLNEDYSSNDFPYQEKMLEYTANIIERNHQIDGKMMQFILSNMDIECRRHFIDFTYEGSIPSDEKKGNNENEYYHVMEEIHDPSHIGDHMVNDIYRGKIKKKEHEVKEYLVSYLRDQLRLYENRDKCGFNQRINELSDIFNLNDMEIEALLFVFCIYENNSEFWEIDYNNRRTMYDVLKLASSAIRAPLSDLKKILSKNGRLYLCGIIEGFDIKHADSFHLNDNIIEYLAGVSNASLIDQYVRSDRGECFDPMSFSVETDAVDTLVSLISAPGGSNILFYGVAGTGKTELARSLVRSVGKTAYFLQYGGSSMTRRDFRSNSEDRYLALAIAVNSIDPEKGVIIVDEADKILNASAWHNIHDSGPASDKGSLNNFFDTSQAKIIWISNEIFRMEESSLRRFSFSLYFKEFSYRDRINIWNNLLRDHSLRQFIPRKLVEELSYQYRVNAGGIGSALDALAKIYRNSKPDRKSIETKLRDLLERHEQLTKERGNIIKRISPSMI